MQIEGMRHLKGKGFGPILYVETKILAVSPSSTRSLFQCTTCPSHKQTQTCSLHISKLCEILKLAIKVDHTIIGPDAEGQGSLHI